MEFTEKYLNMNPEDIDNYYSVLILIVRMGLLKVKIKKILVLIVVV